MAYYCYTEFPLTAKSLQNRIGSEARASEEHGHERQAFDTRWAGERANTRCKLTISLAAHFNLKFCVQCASLVVLVLAASRYSYKVMRGLRLVDCLKINAPEDECA